MIGYSIVVKADDCEMRIGTFFSDIPIDDKRVRKEIRETLSRYGATNYTADRIEEVVLIAVECDDDEGEVQIFDLDVDDIWPWKAFESDVRFYESGRGDK